MSASRDMVAIPGRTVELGLTAAEADQLATELTQMEQTLLEERQHLDGYEFDFEETFAQRRAWLETSMPVQRIEVASYAIERYPVTVGEYAAYIHETGAKPPAEWALRRPGDPEVANLRDPKATSAKRGESMRETGSVATENDRVFVTGISWREASTYAAHHGLRLPTEAEWELAARWDRRLFPWGNHYFPLGRTAFPEDEWSEKAWVVGSRGELASRWGVHDLIGEFGEYTSEAFLPYPGTDEDLFNQHFSSWRKERAVRGGYNVYMDSTCVYRNGIGPDVRSTRMKFRCVRVGTSE
jgi:iron(II)-dependent oxidoreductase